MYINSIFMRLKNGRGKKMIIKGEKTLFGEEIKTPEEFIEDFCDRLNNILNLAMEENLGDQVLEQKNTEVQLSYLLGAIMGLATRLNRVCGRL